MTAGDLKAEQADELRHGLLAWFDRHKRDLPWRRSRDPYAIWVSEIMLQQTRVAAVLAHYARWMQRFPTVAALAEAGEPEVLALWSGLGYYRRARFLHKGAQAVVREYAGALPGTAEALRLLPGIGEYTAAAVASIAFGQAVAVVDGNVERVIMRLAGLARQQRPATSVKEPAQAYDGRAQPGRGESLRGEPGAAGPGLGAAPLAREIRRIADELLARERPGDYNQAMMELGATVCLPRAPLCLHCPVQPWCATRGEHAGALRKAMQSRSISYALGRRERQGECEVLLAQRPGDASLMPGMWELPEMEDAAENAAVPLLTVRHAITVTNYTVRIIARGEETARKGTPKDLRWVGLTQLPEMALTGLARKVLKRLALWPEAVGFVKDC